MIFHDSKYNYFPIYLTIETLKYNTMTTNRTDFQSQNLNIIFKQILQNKECQFKHNKTETNCNGDKLNRIIYIMKNTF